ncbi:MAG: hypothetical protein NC452_18080 [Eubacterium sp.]|nr:hypothetical protein [Eubacterium sp.]
MGRFSTTVHVKTDLNISEFQQAFLDVMKGHGFEPCSEDKEELSYLLAFSKGGWVTISSEGYADDPDKVGGDMSSITEKLKTSAFSVEVVDSDFAILKLIGGDISDKVVVGDGSGYGIENGAKGSKACWEPLLPENKTWEELSEAWEGSGVFVEDTLSESAAVLGINPEYMSADHKTLCDKATNDTDIAALYFTKKAADSKNKSMSFNSAFIKVFGEGLEPYGFKRLMKTKNKIPFFVRAAGGEILHIVSYRTVTSSKLKHKCIEVLCGAVSLYRQKMDFTVSAENWYDMVNVSRFMDRFSDEIGIEPSFMKKTIETLGVKPRRYADYVDGKLCWVTTTLEETFCSGIADFHCKTDDGEQMLRDLSNAFNAAKSVFLPVFDRIVDLNALINYERGIFGEEQTALRHEMPDNPKLNKKVIEEPERCKAKNIEMLRGYGLLNIERSNGCDI